MSGLSRRDFVAGLSVAAWLPFLNDPVAAGQAPARLLPVNTPKIDHLDVIVPNVESSARFYMGVFNTTLRAQPFQGGFRYFVLFGDLPANRAGRYWPSAIRAAGAPTSATSARRSSTTGATARRSRRRSRRPSRKKVSARCRAAAASAASSPIPTASRSSSCPRPILW